MISFPLFSLNLILCIELGEIESVRKQNNGRFLWICTNLVTILDGNSWILCNYLEYVILFSFHFIVFLDSRWFFFYFEYFRHNNFLSRNFYWTLSNWLTEMRIIIRDLAKVCFMKKLIFLVDFCLLSVFTFLGLCVYVT